MHCPQCQHENPPDAKFCLECGTQLVLACAQCGVQLPPSAKFCLECGASLTAAPTPSAAPPRQPAMIAAAPAEAGERRQLTLLFSDLVGSTELSTHLDPEEWRDRVAQYHRATADVITRFGGYVAKYLGDGVLALFGYPQAHEDDAERAVRAGLAILEGVKGLAAASVASAPSPLSVRIGIHTGLTVIADAGGKADVFGETPNVAARVQSAAEPDTVAITAATQRLVAGLFVIEDRGAQQLKGIKQPVQLYRVVGVGVGRRHTHTGRLTPFVGREDEMRMLLGRWERVREGEGQVVLVVGEAGIGKSRLLQEFRTRITPDPHLWIESAGEQFFDHTPFHAVTQMLDQALGWRGCQRTEERISGLERALALAGLKLNEAVPLMAEMLDLPIPSTYPPLPFAPDQRRKRLFAALVGWVFGATTLQPLVLALEDLHWVDPSTLEFLQTLVEQGATVPLLLIATARPEFHAPWPMRAHHAQITLNRLNDRHTRAMVTGVMARAGLPQDVFDAVVKRTDGVPLFAEELTRLLLEGDGRVAAREIPTTLHDSLTARLDRLGRAKEVAQLGAVLGREFSYELLQAMSPLREEELQASLTKLTDAELLYARGMAPEATYQFKHALMQDAAYEALLKSTRRELHRRVAQTLTERFPALAEAQPQVLARHWSDAGETESAVAAWTKAAQAADARHAYKEAEEGYRQALAMLGTLPASPERDARELELASALSPVLYATRGFTAPETVELATRALALAAKGGNLPQLVLQVFANCVSVWNSGDYPTAASLADQALDIARREGSDPSLRFAHESQFMVRFFRGDLVGAEEHFALWSRLCETSGYGQFPGETPLAMSIGAYCAWALGYADSARERSGRATAFARESKNPYDLALGLNWESALYVKLREPLRVEAAAAQAVAICDEHGFPRFGKSARVSLGWARAQLGRAGEGVALIHQAVAGLVESGGRAAITDHLSRLAEAQALNGAIADALATIEDALTANPEELFFRPHSLTCRGELRLTVGQTELAEADFRDAIALAQTMHAKAFELRATTHLARLLAHHGHRDEARTLLAEIYRWFSEGFDTRDLQDAKALLAEL